MTKIKFLETIKKKYGEIRKLPNSLSLFDVGDSSIRLYLRYSKIHARNEAFYGLRQEDLQQLEGKNSVICFLWKEQEDPLFIPFADYEEVFSSLTPASDGQLKAHVDFQEDGTELYMANAGRFNVEGFYGWKVLDQLIDKSKILKIPDFSHFQIQSFIGSIGNKKDFDIWIPMNDRKKIEDNQSDKLNFRDIFPARYEKISNIIKEIDVIWISRGSNDIKAMFEVEHSTPIYSGLLRFNDLHLIEPNLKPRYNIVSNSIRKSLFLRQINRPTFTTSGLIEVCNFLEYKDVFGWFSRIMEG